MGRYDELMDLYIELKDRLDRLEGRQHGPISMTEAREAWERGDRAILHQYLQQEEGTARERCGQ